MTKPQVICAVCKRSGGRGMADYQTILQAMGYVGHSHAHSKCILEVQQMAIQAFAKLRKPTANRKRAK